jgi:hypothetical protein
MPNYAVNLGTLEYTESDLKAAHEEMTDQSQAPRVHSCSFYPKTTLCSSFLTVKLQISPLLHN